MEMIIIDRAVLTGLFKKIDSLQVKLDSLYEKSGLKPKMWISNEEACMMLNASKTTLLNLRRGNIVPYTKFGGKVFYKLEDIEKLLSCGYRLTNINQ